jgi:hypothetical protein
MDPRERFCHNERCWAYGRAGEGHIVIHSRKECRYRCKRCGRTFSATKGTALYRAHKPHELVVTIVTLLAYGCPPQAIVAAFSLWTSVPSLAGNARAGGSVGGFTNTSFRPEECSWGRFSGR